MPIRREEAGFGQATERPQQACQLPREEAGLGQAAAGLPAGEASDRPLEVLGRVLLGLANCFTRGFEGGPKCLATERPQQACQLGGPKCLTSPSEAHKKRGGRLRTGHREAATGLPAAEEGLKAVQKCLTSPSDAHKRRGGRLRTGHREAATGLPAAERGGRPRTGRSRPASWRGLGQAFGSAWKGSARLGQLLHPRV